ncbi:MAG TPA: fused MFS/spermidine synthase [bacterium]|nr:fused MFS/spermidine synthase [bacterium]
MKPTPKGLVFVFFLLSGFCSLLYQVVWLRLAFAAFGVITPVLSVVLSVFMAGLFAGTWGAGRWIGALTRRSGWPALAFYALAELAVAAGAFAVPRLFALGQAALLGSGASDSTGYLLRSALVITAALFPWCAAMGATLPCMLAHLRGGGERGEDGFSFLYLANVLGAMLGVLATALVLVEALGLHRTLYLAASLNALVALGAGAAAWRWRGSGPAAAPAPEPSGPRAPGGPLAVLFMTGFCSMAMEVVWTRAFTPVIKTQVYSFALILFCYLLATFLGSALYRRHLRAGKLTGTTSLLAGLAVGALLPLLLNDPRLQLGPGGALASLFPFCIGLGYLTPRLVDQVSRGGAAGAGRAYACNILGSCLGPLAASYALLPWMGVKAALLLLALPFLAAWWWWPRSGRSGGRRAWAGAAALASLALCLAGLRTYEDPPAGSSEPWVVKRDATATTVAYGGPGSTGLLVNGIGITTATTITKVMAHLPAAFLPRPPASALVICFGMGTTFRALSSWGVPTTAVELVPSVRDQFGFFFSDAAQVLARPGNRVVIDDGRRFLTRDQNSYDVITVDPPPPMEAAASSLLYSEEFYGLVKRRLKPGGILQQWVPGGDPSTVLAMARSLRDQFPYVRMFLSIEGWGYHFLASQQPLPPTSAETLVARMPPAARADLMEWFPKGKPVKLLAAVLAREYDLQATLAHWPTALTDDRPYNEYYLLRRWFPGLAPHLN